MTNDQELKAREAADDKLIIGAFQHLLDTYLNSRHRKKVDIITKAFNFARQAHKGVRRLSGEPYIMHPIAVAQIACEEVGLGSTSICAALLHDVVEDTNITIDDIGYIYSLMNLRAYFDNNIRTSLINITHNKNEDYQDYIFRCMEHPTSALVKMIDLNDNLNVLSLISLDDKKFNRCVKYLTYIKLINDEFSFLEKINAYNKERNQKVIQSN